MQLGARSFSQADSLVGSVGRTQHSRGTGAYQPTGQNTVGNRSNSEAAVKAETQQSTSLRTNSRVGSYFNQHSEGE